VREQALAPRAAAAPVPAGPTRVFNAGSVQVPRNPRTRRVQTELKEIREWEQNGNRERIFVFPGEDPTVSWKALMEGPPGTPFEGGVFVVAVQLPNDYPFKPPQIRFETPVYHCNVSDAGALCLSLLKDNWSPALSIPKCLIAIRNLLGDPNTDDALRAWIAEITVAYRASGGRDTRYFDIAREHTLKHASKTVEQWKRDWNL